MKKPLKLYAIYLVTKRAYFGMQYVKANNKKHAKEKFKKRFKSSRILDCDLIEKPEFRQQSLSI